MRYFRHARRGSTRWRAVATLGPVPVLYGAAGRGEVDWHVWGVVGLVGVGVGTWLVTGLRQAGSVIDKVSHQAAVADPYPAPPEATICLNLARHGDAELLGKLLDAGVGANLADDEGTTPLMVAAQHGHCGVVRALVRHGAEVNRVNADGQTALTRALLGGRPDIVQQLLAAGADPALGAPTALRLAARLGHAHVLRAS